MPNETRPAASAQPTWWVVCLCAQWCGVCREFRAAFDVWSRGRADLRVIWVDVEDEEAVVGDLDIETFPTVLIADGREARFFGPVLPQIGVLARMLESLQQMGANPSPLLPEEVQALFRRVADG